MELCNNCSKSDELKHLRIKNEEHEKRIAELEKNSSVQEYQFKSIMESLKELKEDVTEIKSRPSENWKTVMTASITGLVSFLVAKFFN